MKILALITARSGSKRLPGKNLRLLGGIPLIVWSIKAAKGVPCISDIMVSTDSLEIAAISKQAGAYVPWLRPSKLSTDDATSVDVVLHALDMYEAEKGVVDGVILLQPTSPFRSHKKINEGIQLFLKNNFQAVVGVSLVDTHPMWMMNIVDGGLAPYMGLHGLEIRSQDLPPVYYVNGYFYMASPKQLRLSRSFFEPSPLPLLVETKEESIDIDTFADFQYAEFILEKTRGI